MMLWFHIVVLLFINRYVVGQDSPTTQSPPAPPSPQDPPTPKPKEEVDRGSDIYPYLMPDILVKTRVLWEEGYLNEFPAYAIAYDPPQSDTLFYIFPPRDCPAVWFCFTAYQFWHEEYINITFNDICSNSLRFNTLEQTIYQHEKNDTKLKLESYPYYSNVIEILVESYEENKTIQTNASDPKTKFDITVTRRNYFFRPYEDFLEEGEGEYELRQRKKKVKLNMEGMNILLLSASPYCKATAVQPFKGAVPGFRLSIMPNDAKDYLKTGKEPSAKSSPYFLTGTKAGSRARSKLWNKRKTKTFDDPSKRKNLMVAADDCCPFTWEFENFIQSWKPRDQITYHRYSLLKDKRNDCQRTTGANVLYQSVLLELGEACQWLRICFDVKEDRKDKLTHFCEDDVNTLSFIFVHGVYIPTDSDEARPLGVEVEDLETIRINFLLGSKGIELAYAFADYTATAIRDVMQLEVYDGMDPSKLQLNVVKAPNCRARLLNDLGTTNIRTGQEARLQCLSIRDCECLEQKS